MPTKKLLITMSLPMMASMLVQALYNIVDSIFVSRISENALTAVSLAFPIQSLIIAVGVGTGVGINALLSKTLGEKEQEKANAVAVNGIFAAAVSYIIFLVIGIVVTEPFYQTQTQIPEIVTYGTQYLTICCCTSFGMFTQMTFERLLQSTGKTIYTMCTQVLGAVINLILDPILIFGLFGFPRMEVAGAAIATVIGQICAGILAIVFNMTQNHELHISFKKFKPNWQLIGDIYKVGAPSIIVQAGGSLMVYGMNRILITFTETATAVFGVYFKLQSFIFMPVFGLNNGMVPIIAYNYGAGRKERVLETMKYSMILAAGIMLVGLVIMEAVPVQLLQLFQASEHMLAIGVPALRIICLSFAFAGICIVGGSVFQALGNGVYSMVVAIARQLVVLLPAAYLLAQSGHVEYVWFAFPIAEMVSIIMTVYFLRKIYKKVICHIGENVKAV